MRSVEDNHAVICDYAPAAPGPVKLGKGWIAAGAILALIAWAGYGVCLQNPTSFEQVMNGVLIACGACGISLLMLAVIAVRVGRRCSIAFLLQKTIGVLAIFLIAQFVAFYLADDIFVRF